MKLQKTIQFRVVPFRSSRAQSQHVRWKKEFSNCDQNWTVPHSTEEIRRHVLQSGTAMVTRLEEWRTTPSNRFMRAKQGYIDKGNWVHDSAGADVIFVVSLPLRSRVLNVFCLFCCCESPQTSLGLVFLERS